MILLVINVYDVIIIGMGPAGITAAIYAIRSGLKTLLLEKDVPGGLVNYTSIVNNYPGLPNISGPDLAYKYFEHVNELNIPYKIEEVLNITVNKKNDKIVKTKNSEYKSKTVIVATGRSHRKLNLSNVDSLEGKGISYCAVCDGPLYKDQEVAVIGGGNSALGQALYLANLCKKVTILNRSEKFRGDEDYQTKIKKLDNVKIMMNAEVVKIIEKNNKVNTLVLNNGSKLKVDGLFVYVGFNASTKFIENLNITNDYGYILVDKNYETNIPGLFACGDIIVKSLYQIINAASEGALAANSAFEYLKRK